MNTTWIALFFFLVTQKCFARTLRERRTKTCIELHPYQASMRVNGGSDASNFCGGFIVSERFIVTAAHCVEQSNASTITLHVGSTVREKGTLVPIDEVTLHPGYNTFNFDLDVAVLKTKEPIKYSDEVQPIKLAPVGRVVVKESKVEVSGWGKHTSESEDLSYQLKYLKMPVVNQDKCYRSYPRTLNENKFCAGYFYSGGLDACQGDSGGAAVQDGLAVGIVSYGRGCGVPRFPTVYASISAKPIRDFLKEHTGL